MEDARKDLALTDSLEDYLETAYELVREMGFARVKDIAKQRGVRPASVSQALQRLSELELIMYEKRGYLTLTRAGEEHARRVLARHHVLSRLFEDILKIDPETASRDACTMEHGLSSETMGRIVKFFEFIVACPDAAEIMNRFQSCSLINEEKVECQKRCTPELKLFRKQRGIGKTLADLEPWRKGRVTQITGRGAIRQRLLDMGILPDVVVEVERIAPTGDPLWIKLDGFQLSLRREEARTIIVDELSQ